MTQARLDYFAAAPDAMKGRFCRKSGVRAGDEPASPWILICSDR
jgi:hypothetical protein